MLKFLILETKTSIMPCYYLHEDKECFFHWLLTFVKFDCCRYNLKNSQKIDSSASNHNFQMLNTRTTDGQNWAKWAKLGKNFTCIEKYLVTNFIVYMHFSRDCHQSKKMQTNTKIQRPRNNVMLQQQWMLIKNLLSKRRKH